MTRVASRELRNDTAGVLRRAAGGKPIEITVNVEPVARIAALVPEKSHWTSRSLLIDKLARIQADPGLRDELAELNAVDDELGPIQ